MKKKSPRNQTIELTESELAFYSDKLITVSKNVTVEEILNKTINQDLLNVIDFLPESFVDLLIIDPPYNLTKTFNNNLFSRKTIEEYAEWVDEFLSKLKKILKPTASVYFCSDWHSSTSVHLILSKYFIVRNRITWEREKGRGAKTNWKNSSEDIWFCTVSDEYSFYPERVKLKRKVLAPYKHEGQPKDWIIENGKSYRLTYPSNIWTDISVPFWSMPENTEHPTQKPEKLIAKIILASSNEGDIVFDPFLGSGTTSVVAKKLKRNFIGIEREKIYACLAEKRLKMAEENSSIQGFCDGVFWERNSNILKNLAKD